MNVSSDSSVWRLLAATVLVCALALASGGSGCIPLGEGDGDAAGGADVSGGQSVADIAAPQPPSAPGDPDKDPAALPWCQPQPSFPRSDIAADAFARYSAHAAAGCQLSRVEHDDDGDGFPELVEDLPADGSLSFAYAWEAPAYPGARHDDRWTAVVRSDLDPDGGVVLTADARAAGSTALRQIIRAYDGAGRLVTEKTLWNDRLWYALDLTWESDLLVAATYVDYVNLGPASEPLSWTFSWTYDAQGRLARGAVEGGRAADAVATVSWEYTPEGRPARAVRSADDEPWLIQSWRYGDDGRLADRRVERLQPAFGSQHPLDDMRPEQLRADTFGQAGWSDALVRPANGCARLPTALGHGYPEGEEVYVLGWPNASRPAGMGFDYGYGGYAYGYGDGAWFGHGGVAGGLDVLASGERAWAEVRYDEAGRAIAERVAAQPQVDAGGELAFTYRAERTRAYEDGLLISDTRSIAPPDDDSADGGQSTIRLLYDDVGRLTERHYAIDDMLLAEHTWSRDASGHVARHTIAHHGSAYGSFAGQEWGWEPIPPSFEPPRDSPQLRWTHDHVRSDDELQVVKKKRDARDDSVVVYGEEKWEPTGSLTVRRGAGATETLTYDPAGRLELHGWDFDGDGELERYDRRVRDDDDRLTLHESFDAAAGTHAVTRYTHACP